MDPLEDLRVRLRAFAAERDWEQFHTPKNLVMALAAESGELLEQFQWLTPEQSVQLDARRRDAVSAELADVFIYLVRLADRLDVDLWSAARAKLARNEARYPAQKVRGRADKYDEYD